MSNNFLLEDNEWAIFFDIFFVAWNQTVSDMVFYLIVFTRIFVRLNYTGKMFVCLVLLC